MRRQSPRRHLQLEQAQRACSPTCRTQLRKEHLDGAPKDTGGPGQLSRCVHRVMRVEETEKTQQEPGALEWGPPLLICAP